MIVPAAPVTTVGDIRRAEQREELTIFGVGGFSISKIYNSMASYHWERM
jgi:hypothetical protein